MNTENLSRWLTLFANFGVVVGIIFLAFELQLFVGIARSPGYAAYLETDTAAFIGEDLRNYMRQLSTEE